MISRNDIYGEGYYLIFLQPLKTVAVPVTAGLAALCGGVGLLPDGLDKERCCCFWDMCMCVSVCAYVSNPHKIADGIGIVPF